MALIADLDREHPEYTLRKDLWRRLSILFKGGDDFARVSSEFILARPKEPSDIYQRRLERSTYQNVLGTVISWYTSALWQKAIDIDRDPPGTVEDDYYDLFLENCDRNSTHLTDFFQARIESALLYRRSFVLVDLPQVDIPALNLKAQIQAGDLDAYLVPYEPDQVINWSTDRFGRLEWVVIRTTEQRQAFLGTPENVTRWWYFDRVNYVVFESRKRGNAQSDDEDTADEIARGLHAMASSQVVPLFCLELPDSLWIGDRMYLQALDHLNQDNSYAWALFMANLPLPVFTTDKEVGGTAFSEASAIVLAPGEAFHWAEPSGTSFVHSANRVSELREEMYRTAYLHSQGIAGSDTAGNQSGYAKELDMMPSREVMNAIGSKLRASMKDVLQAVGSIRSDEIEFTIRGFDFEEKDASSELDLCEQIALVDLPSDTVRKYQLKRAARAVMASAPEDDKLAAMSEIEASPTIDQMKQEQAAAAQLQVDQQLQKASAGYVAKAA